MTSQFAIRASKHRNSSSKPLRRGQACINCRTLKIKCDGAKPHCGPCVRNPRQEPCEYTDDIANSKTRALEEMVAQLQARISELESSTQTSSPTVTLTSPYGATDDNRISSPHPLVPQYRLDSWSENSSSSAPSTPFGYHARDFKPARQSSPVSSSSSNVALFDDPPFSIMEALINTFISVATDFGFFLDITGFKSCYSAPFPAGHHSRPAPALLSAAYLLGAHTSSQESLRQYETLYLRRALQQTSIELSGVHPHRIMHTLQAEVLLAYYFFRNGRYVEAKCHTSAAVSICLTCGLHRIRSSQPSSPGGMMDGYGSMLGPSMDIVEEGERINAFWTVFILHKCIAVALDPPGSLCGAFEAPGIRIDTPWPLDMANYRDGLMPPNLHGAATVRNFLNDRHPVDPLDGQSNFALYAKAAVMFHRAAHLSGQWSSETAQYSQAFRSLDELVEKFKLQLNLSGDPSESTYIMARALASAASLKLHSPFSQSDPSSASRCLVAAEAIIDLSASLQNRDRPCINPIYGTIWMDACMVLARELTRQQSISNSWPELVEQDVGNEKQVAGWLQTGLSTMQNYASNSSLMNLQLARVNEVLM